MATPTTPAPVAPARGPLVLALAALTLLGALLGYREITSPDLGFHLATARWMLAHGWVPSTDPFTFTVSDHAYVDLQWLYQLLVLGLSNLAGSPAIVLFTALTTLGFGALLLARSARRNGRLGTGALVLVLLFFLGTHWEPRPHLLSWLWGSLLLWILEENERGARRWLPCIPVVMALWVNSHSLFVLGLVILGTHVAGHLLQRVLHAGTALDRRLLAWSGAGALACLLNPYHVRGLLFPLVQLADIQGGSAYKDAATGIAEFGSPFGLAGYHVDGHLVLLQPLLWWQLFALLAAVGAWRGRKAMRLTEWILFAGFLYVLGSANKNFGYFVMAVLPSAAAGLDAQWLRRTGPVAVGALALAFAALTWSGRLYDLAWSANRRGTGFNASFLPVGAAGFLSENDVHGRLLNTWNDGGWLAWRTGQPVTIYSHGEVMGQDFYRRYVHAKEPQGFEDALRTWRPTVAVVPFESADYWLYHLARQRDWRLVFVDERSAVFLHGTVALEVPALPEPVAGTDYPALDELHLAERVRAVAARPAPGLGAWLRGAAAFPTRQTARAGFFTQTARYDAAIATALDGLEHTPFAVADLLLTLGYALEGERRHDLADACFGAFLRLDHDPVLARGIREVQRGR